MLFLFSEPLWPSGKAGDWTTSVQFSAAALLSLERL